MGYPSDVIDAEWDYLTDIVESPGGPILLLR